MYKLKTVWSYSNFGGNRLLLLTKNAFMKSEQKNWAGPSPPSPLIWTKSKRTATFFSWSLPLWWLSAAIFPPRLHLCTNNHLADNNAKLGDGGWTKTILGCDLATFGSSKLQSELEHPPEYNSVVDWSRMLWTFSKFSKLPRWDTCPHILEPLNFWSFWSISACESCLPSVLATYLPRSSRGSGKSLLRQKVSPHNSFFLKALA